ncbi:hypothetical protein ERJ75_001381200 [Trypanosoma vivax]|nr:hypothetical protein ERJ75_001381200 [Trypanosoma vivax]
MLFSILTEPCLCLAGLATAPATLKTSRRRSAQPRPPPCLAKRYVETACAGRWAGFPDAFPHRPRSAHPVRPRRKSGGKAVCGAVGDQRPLTARAGFGSGASCGCADGPSSAMSSFGMLAKLVPKSTSLCLRFPARPCSFALASRRAPEKCASLPALDLRRAVLSLPPRLAALSLQVRCEALRECALRRAAWALGRPLRGRRPRHRLVRRPPSHCCGARTQPACATACAQRRVGRTHGLAALHLRGGPPEGVSAFVAHAVPPPTPVGHSPRPVPEPPISSPSAWPSRVAEGEMAHRVPDASPTRDAAAICSDIPCCAWGALLRPTAPPRSSLPSLWRRLLRACVR